MKTVLSPSPSVSSQKFRFALNKTFVLSSLLGALLTSPVFADDSADVTKLLKAGKYAEAIAKADAALVQRPRDPQLRFLKGVILTEQNKPSEAITIFTKLTEEFPDLPEPYNNLAVLYASSAQYEKARAALDMAIRTNPSYATAYENLGDVHAKLASQAYDKALQLDSGNNAAKSKLTLLRSMGSSSSVASARPVAAPSPAPAPATVPPVARQTVTPAAPAARTPIPVQAAVPTPATVQVAVPKPEPAKLESKPVKPARNEDSEDVLNVVQAWAKAWSAQDVKAYLSYYGNDFQVPGGLSRKAWAEEREQRIEGKGSINVKVESPRVSVSGSTATVKFRQIYVSDRLKADSHKTLVLTKQGAKWQIKQERSGS